VDTLLLVLHLEDIPPNSRGANHQHLREGMVEDILPSNPKGNGASNLKDKGSGVNNLKGKVSGVNHRKGKPRGDNSHKDKLRGANNHLTEVLHKEVHPAMEVRRAMEEEGSPRMEPHKEVRPALEEGMAETSNN